jgi:hypothetical protein
MVLRKPCLRQAAKTLGNIPIHAELKEYTTMLDKLIQLEKQLAGLASPSELSENNLMSFPEEFRHIHGYKVFGGDLLAIPANLIVEGDDDEFENLFCFLDTEDGIKTFESEFRPEIPAEFIPIGYLNLGTEIVLLNKMKSTVHVFHVSEVVDPEWLKYKLENAISDLVTFINSIKPQTVCCLMDPKNASKYDMFEIRNDNEIMTYNDRLKYPDKETAWNGFKDLIKKSIGKGYEIHYAPKKILIELEN